MLFRDSEGHLTFGIGHLIKSSDPEHGMPCGTVVTEERVLSAFDNDVAGFETDYYRLYPDFDSQPEFVQVGLINSIQLLTRKRPVSSLSHLKNHIRDDNRYTGSVMIFGDSKLRNWYKFACLLWSDIIPLNIHPTEYRW